MLWMLAAIGSAIFAGLTSILAKCGIRQTDSDVATAVRTIVVVIFAWLMVWIVGSFHTIYSISPYSLLFLGLSGIATGASWICYFKALSIGDVNKVVPIDKSSTILTVILAIILFGETNHLVVKLACTAVLGLGVFMMIEKKSSTSPNSTEDDKNANEYLVYAILSAVFAAATSILAKYGISDVESNLGTAIRTCFVLVMAWLVVYLRGIGHLLSHMPKNESLFIILSGIATGASWLCYYYAIQNGIVSIVVPIDKLSVIVSIIFSYFVFGERLNKRTFTGLMLMIGATLVMAIFA